MVPKRFLKSLIFLFILSCSKQLVWASNPLNVENILSQAYTVNRNIDSISLTIILKERIKSYYIQKKSDFKIVFNPFRVYFIQRYPNKGMEVLYNNDILGEKALINRNTIALSTLKLNPSGNLMRKESHHSIYKAGFSYLLNVLEHLGRKYPYSNKAVWQYMGKVKYADQICHKISFKNPGFRYSEYTIKEGENLETIAQRDMISDYLIFENNPHINSFDDFTPGKNITVPNDYAKEIIVYIEQDMMVPIGLKTYDNIGLYEEYTYLNINLNPQFSQADFHYENPEYGFW